MNDNRLINILRLLLEQPKLVLSYSNSLKPINYYHCLTAKDICKKEIKTLIDIGANVGNYTSAGKVVFPTAKIYAFEPIESCYKKIQTKGVTTFNFALGDIDNKEDIFYLNEVVPEISSFLKYGKEQSGQVKNLKEIKVLKRRFDKLNIKIERPCFVKIDVEGLDYNVLLGFGERLKEVDLLQIEWHFGDFFEGHEKLSKLFSLLELYGFDCFIQKSLGYSKGKMSGCDLFFFRSK